MVTEFRAEHITGQQQRGHTAKPRIMNETQAVAQGSPLLLCQKIAAEGRTGRDTDHAVNPDCLIEEHIQHACRKQTSQRTALKHHTELMLH